MNDKIRKLEIRMVLIFALIMVTISLTMMSVLNMQSNKILKSYVSELAAANGRQIELNIDTYLKKIEKNAALLFAEEDFIKYNKADTELSDYDKIQQESSIEDEIIDLSLMENFTDFAVIYSDDSTIGWISKNTAELFADGGMYESFSASLGEKQEENNGWSFLSEDKFSRIYFAKRFNENAIILVSFYGTELDSAFEVPETLQSMTIRLTTADDRIVYSTDPDEIGDSLPNKLKALLGENNKQSQIAMNKEFLVTAHACSNSWKVVCSIPTDALMRNTQILYRNSVILVLVLSAMGILIGFAFYYKLSSKMNVMVGEIKEQADSDRMTGLLNKAAFMAQVGQDLEEYTGKQANCFMMIDIDDFKRINDELGHARGDETIIRLSRLLKEVFSDNAKIGRVGGDEFAVYVSYTRIDREQAEERMRGQIERILETLKNKELEEEENRISVSCGAVIAGAGEYTYDMLYRRADKMLYLSKKNGKGRVTFEGDVSESCTDSTGGEQR